MKYKNELGEWVTINVRALDSLPVGTELEYDGTDIPVGWEQVDDPYAYSTNEQVIGTWVDGKPLYRKTFIVTDMGTVSAGSYKNVNTGLTNVNIKKIQALEIYTTGGQEYTRTIPNTIGISSVVTTTTGSAIRVYPESNSIAVNSTVNVIIEYTKASDSNSLLYSVNPLSMTNAEISNEEETTDTI